MASSDDNIFRWTAPSEQVLLTLREFFERVERNYTGTNNKKEYLYFSGSFDDFPEVENDLSPSEEIDSWLRVRLEDGHDIEPIKMVWIGAKGVTAHTHYDSLYNFFIQLHGHKTFLLSPPSAYNSLYLYPTIHPSYRQSQVDFERVDSTKFPKFHDIPLYQVTLGPGDVL
ncbi:hypothetical protein HMI54_010592, partial [Coelomomyces lativittatus]